MATGFTNKELKVLGTNIYPDAQPQLVNLEDKQVLVWIADNPTEPLPTELCWFILCMIRTAAYGVNLWQ